MSDTSFYQNLDGVAAAVAEGRHREIVGGLWDEIGKLQVDFLRAQGLQPASALLDIGCGCLRGGVQFVDYLAPGRYFGIDTSAALLHAGYDIEIANRGLSRKLPREHLVCDGDFNFDRFPERFDFAIAQSIFAHLPANQIRLCLSQLSGRMKPGGCLFATFFLVPDDHPVGAPFGHRDGVCTYDHQDPYHYRFKQVRQIVEALPWSVSLIGQWGHPRDQQMVLFQPLPHAEEADPATRALGPDEAAHLQAGAAHYRAYVGPPDRYDFMSGSQFALLFTLGLREHHNVLDLGCGSLRLGRLLIPYLRTGRYFGIDPNRWLIEDAIGKELGWDIIGLKQPSFSFNSDFRCDAFGARFEFIVAQSILTHCNADLAVEVLTHMRAALADTGKILFSIIKAASPVATRPVQGWTYPDCVSYCSDEIALMCARAGLQCVEISWYHPGAVWFVAANSNELLPQAGDLHLLRGAMLFEPQFAASRGFIRD